MTTDTNLLHAAIRLALAGLFGAVVGWERERHEKGAGLRTHMLICLGACLFSLIALRIKEQFPDGDVMRVMQGLLLSIGFIAGGVIFTRGGAVTGLTTAAGIWVLTGVGLALGFGFYLLGALGTAFAIVIISAVRRVERHIHRRPPANPPGDAPSGS